jgi:glucan phosphoethanolaminetransferase (alkaline phosphatase superfamily)
LPADNITPIAAKPFFGVNVAWISLAVSTYIILFFNLSFWKGIIKKISALQYSHDDLFDSVPGLLDIQTKEYDPREDIFALDKNIQS